MWEAFLGPVWGALGRKIRSTHAIPRQAVSKWLTLRDYLSAACAAETVPMNATADCPDRAGRHRRWTTEMKVGSHRPAFGEPGYVSGH
jgi:hypothetical protein